VEGAEIQTNGTGKLFNEIEAEHYPSLGNDMDTLVQEACELQIDMTRKEPLYILYPNYSSDI
jgi:hypothetical protein